MLKAWAYFNISKSCLSIFLSFPCIDKGICFLKPNKIPKEKRTPYNQNCQKNYVVLWKINFYFVVLSFDLKSFEI
jgi:hypothetical protein